MFFTKDTDGNYVGYHCDGNDDNPVPLCERIYIKGIDNEKPLYLAFNRTDWFPNHLRHDSKENFINYEVKFKVDKVFTTTDPEEYFDIYWYHADYLNRAIKPDRIEKIKLLIEEGCDLIIYETDDELKEAFLLNPKEHIVSLEPIDNILSIFGDRLPANENVMCYTLKSDYNGVAIYTSYEQASLYTEVNIILIYDMCANPEKYKGKPIDNMIFMTMLHALKRTVKEFFS